jgi:hypothetical protein
VNRPAVSGSHLDDPLRTRGIRFLVIAEQARHLSTRDPGQAGQLLERACRLFAQAGSVGEAAAAMGTLADIAYRRGNSEEVLRIRREVKLPVYPGSSAPARGPGLQRVRLPSTPNLTICTRMYRRSCYSPCAPNRRYVIVRADYNMPARSATRPRER